MSASVGIAEIVCQHLVAEAPMADEGYHLLLGIDWLSRRSFQFGPGPAFMLSW